MRGFQLEGGCFNKREVGSNYREQFQLENGFHLEGEEFQLEEGFQRKGWGAN